jgi:hypothetical protein
MSMMGEPDHGGVGDARDDRDQVDEKDGAHR